MSLFYIIPGQMITEKDIQTRTAEILADAGFNVVASEVDEGF